MNLQSKLVRAVIAGLAIIGLLAPYTAPVAQTQSAEALPAQAPAKNPNIVIILADDAALMDF
ncbi:MAG: hypothetical protein AAFY81_02985, partial [Pseudomonadota bacterium]